MTKLSEDSEIPFLNVLNKAVLEGCAELREEVYAPLINFNKNLAGKVVRERELTPTFKEDAGPAQDENPPPDSTGPDDVGFERGYESEAPQDTGLVEGGIEGTVPTPEEFREAVIATAQHIANHPPFTGQFNIPSSNLFPSDETADLEDSVESKETESVG